jgi:hypothetical protein
MRIEWTPTEPDGTYAGATAGHAGLMTAGTTVPTVIATMQQADARTTSATVPDTAGTPTWSAPLRAQAPVPRR